MATRIHGVNPDGVRLVIHVEPTVTKAREWALDYAAAVVLRPGEAYVVREGIMRSLDVIWRIGDQETFRIQVRQA